MNLDVCIKNEMFKQIFYSSFNFYKGTNCNFTDLGSKEMSLMAKALGFIPGSRLWSQNTNNRLDVEP